MKRSSIAIALTVLATSAYGSSKSILPLFKEGEVVVKLKNQIGIESTEQTHKLFTELSNRFDVSVKNFDTDQELLTVKVNSQNSMNEILEVVSKNDSVEYAEPNFIYSHFEYSETDPQPVIPSDPNFKLDWGIFNTGQNDASGQAGLVGSDVGATKAWNLSKGSSDVSVAVIDTGVDYTHEELKDNIFINTGEIAGNGKDDDGNGFIDDVHGWNFAGKNNDPMDDNKHGTHCSGTIGAKGDNGIGTAGVTWNVKILPIKFLTGSGSGTLADAVEAIKYATKMGVKLMSNSWGGGGFSQTMFDAIKAAETKGILFVAAAGNETNNNDTKATYPSGYKLENVISVAAIDNRDNLATFSNYGQKTVHIAAPGVKIYSTVPMSMGGYATFSGTSMACPHVSGAAALLWSTNKDWTYKQIKDRLLMTKDPVAGLKSKTYAGGRVNVYNAMMNNMKEPWNPPSGGNSGGNGGSNPPPKSIN